MQMTAVENPEALSGSVLTEIQEDLPSSVTLGFYIATPPRISKTKLIQLGPLIELTAETDT